MPVGFADNELIEAVVLFAGGVVARLITSNPPVANVVPTFCMFVTTAIARFGSTAIAVGGPLVGINCMGSVVGGVASNSGVKSIPERLLPPEFAIKASARS